MTFSDARKFIVFLASHIERLAQLNDAAAVHQRLLKSTVFDVRAGSPITLRTNLMDIYAEVECSPCCFMAAYMYVTRYCLRHTLLVEPVNVEHMLLTSVLVAIKFWEDEYCNNAKMACIIGVSLREMNIMEKQLLFGIKFDLHITKLQFLSCCNAMKRIMAADCPDSQPQISRLILGSDGDGVAADDRHESSTGSGY